MKNFSSGAFKPKKKKKKPKPKPNKQTNELNEQTHNNYITVKDDNDILSIQVHVLIKATLTLSNRLGKIWSHRSLK